MNEQTNNPVEKAVPSEVVEDIMSGETEAVRAMETERLAESSDVERSAPTEVETSAEAGGVAGKHLEQAPLVVSAPTEKDPALMQVERKLEDRELWQVYAALPVEQRERFKQEGEALATSLRGMLGRTDVDPTVVFVAIQEWLSHVKGINRHYVLQAAKTKADGVLKLIREHAPSETVL